MLRRRDGRDRVELEEPEPAHRAEDAARGAVEELRPDRDPARLLGRDDPHALGAVATFAAVSSDSVSEIART